VTVVAVWSPAVRRVWAGPPDGRVPGDLDRWAPRHPRQPPTDTDRRVLYALAWRRPSDRTAFPESDRRRGSATYWPLAHPRPATDWPATVLSSTTRWNFFSPPVW